MTHQITPLPSRLNALAAAVLKVLSRQMSAGQLRKLEPDIKKAMYEAVDDLEVEEREKLIKLHTLRPLADWHEDLGPTLWWILPVNEPPYCGTPLDSDWTGGHTHWSPLPDCRLMAATDGVELQ